MNHTNGDYDTQFGYSHFSDICGVALGCTHKKVMEVASPGEVAMLVTESFRRLEEFPDIATLIPMS